ncbi:MAG UNVERIFIED_CONTAM: hypothetical protein LVR29_18275 [Microcystis novacekii LVE1205-3]
MGNATDEFITNTLQNALVGPALGFGRPQHCPAAWMTGITSLNGARRQIQTYLRGVRTSPDWDLPGWCRSNNAIDATLADRRPTCVPISVGGILEPICFIPESLKTFIMAYAR